ncbi:alkylation response protein AidB-like acyl-CoA dehydrogenase [Jatrophihabitans sp. GAS493]|nr:alkylation response protein AidB-like acyl-CoA dehydrogenase [Jatrophihabitans sp. GAS493]
MDQRELVSSTALQVVAEYPPEQVSQREFLEACFDAGLAWVQFPVGLGGLGVAPGLQSVSDTILQAAGGPEVFWLNPMGYGMAAPTLVGHASVELQHKLLRPLYICDEIWCQLFSEPGAGSDLAGLATRAVRSGDGWLIDGQKVWTSAAHKARYGLLLARTDPDVPKHKGMTYFVIDMQAPGVEVRPLRQMNGEAEFNEVYLQQAYIPDGWRLGEVGAGWSVAMTTLMNERNAIGGGSSVRNAGTIADAFQLWRSRPELHTPALRSRLTQLFVDAEVNRLSGDRERAEHGRADAGPRGSIGKLYGAELNQHVYEFCMELLGVEATLYGSYERQYDDGDDPTPLQRKHLRARANTIEGGSAEILRNLIGERVLGLPGDIRVDTRIPWREVPRG